MDKTATLTEKIAKLIEQDMSPKSDLASIFAALEKINHRLDKLESEPMPLHPPVHASAEKFAIAEAIADQVFGSMEKACTFEPNDKPCDHCSMCSSRGF